MCPIGAALKVVYRRYNITHSQLGVNRMSRRCWKRIVQDVGMLHSDSGLGLHGGQRRYGSSHHSICNVRNCMRNTGQRLWHARFDSS
jgi:hypothetical protein